MECVAQVHIRSLQVREVNENGKRSYEAYIMTPGMTKDDIKYGFSLIDIATL